MQTKRDKLDWLMLKYGSWFRIGEHRTYFKFLDDGLVEGLCLYSPDIYEVYVSLTEREGFDESTFISILNHLEFTGEKIVGTMSDIRKLLIYTMAGQYTSYRFMGEDKKIYGEYVDLLNLPSNKNAGNEAIQL